MAAAVAEAAAAAEALAEAAAVDLHSLQSSCS